MRVILDEDRCVLLHGDSAQLGDVLGENNVDAIITDPPAGISFMGQSWDGDKGGRDQWIAWLAELLRPALRALKPGGHALLWAIPRTSHWTAMALELAGFEIRDVHHHLFGTGFPKSLNISKAIDAHLGAERLVVRRAKGVASDDTNSLGSFAPEYDVTVAGFPEARAAEGLGTALKPAVEHWILARKPLDGTYAANVLKHSTGGLNIDACRISYAADGPPAPVFSGAKGGNAGQLYGASGKYQSNVSAVGRWPAHLSLEHAEACAPGACVIGCSVRLLDEQSGNVGSHGGCVKSSMGYTGGGSGVARANLKSKGGASRFFYVAKGSRAEKDAGLDHLTSKSGGEATGREEGSAGTQNPRAGAGRTGGARNHHPTVKSIALMRWLIRLVTPPGGVVLDMFAGSGTTGCAALAEGIRFIGCEMTDEYIPIIEGRLRHALGQMIPGMTGPAGASDPDTNNHQETNT